jgi:hypothetical protein
LRPSRLREFNLELLAQKTNNFSGAEIEQVIVDAMFQNLPTQHHMLVVVLVDFHRVQHHILWDGWDFLTFFTLFLNISFRKCLYSIDTSLFHCFN